MEPKKSQLTYEIVYNKTLNFALFNNGIPLIAGLKLLYTGETPLKNLEITISCWPEFAKTYTRHIEQIDAYGLLFLDDIDIAMQPEYLYSLQERIEGKLDITITADACVPLQEGSESQAGRVTVAQGSSALSILAYEEWNGSSAPPEMLAAFITPNHNLVQQILRASTSYLEQWTSDTSITGYQQGGLTRVKQQMAAIYQAISDLNFRYTGIPASFESTGQKVRLPDAIETQGLINCLDASLLYAAALESAGLHPLVLITHGHALAGCWLVEEFFPEVAYDDMGLIEKRVQPGISEICVVETTCMTSNHPISFDTAVERGTNLCKDPDTRLYYFVDIKRARNSKIRPLPSRRNFTSYTDFSEHHPATLHPEANSAVEAPRDFALADPSLPVNTPQKTRLHMWQKQLLDLSLRNSFISFRSTLSTLALQPPCITTLLEDLLAGEVFSLHPTPEDLQNTPRDLEKLKEQEHGSVLSSIVFQEYQQKRLRTKYDKTMFKKRVTNVHRRARTSLEENGASSLFLVLGMLRWTEHADPLAPVRSAPLVMLPIAITRKSYGKGYTIQKTEDEVVCNETLIEYLKTTFQIDLSCLATLPQKTVGEESIVDLEHLFTMVRRVILNQERWNVEESATIALLSFRKFVMYHDLKNRTQELAKNKIVEALLQNDSSQIEHEHTNVASLDTIPPNMLLAPLSADASQLAAMYAAEQGSSFVLHGPPGTGKSQTITNIIANALANSKRVLFVAEKMAALSVVKKRLHDIGLGDFCLELHSNKTSKRDLLDMLNKTLNKGVYHGAEDFKKQSAKVEELRSELNGYVEALHTVYPVGFSYYHGLNEFERLQEISAQPYFVNGAAATVLAHEFENIKEFLKKLYAAATRAGHPYTLPTGLIKMPELSFSDKQDIAQRARESLGALQELKAAQNTLDNLLGASVPLCELSLADIELVAEFFQIHLPQEQVGPQLVSHYNKEKLNTCIEVLKTYQQTQTTVYQRYQETVHTLDIGALIGLYNVACAKNFLVRGFAKRKVVQHLLPHLKIGVNIKRKQLQSELELIQQYVEAKKAFEAITEEARGYFATSWHAGGNPGLLETTLSIAEHAHKVIAEVQHSHLQKTLRAQGHTLLVHQSTLKDATAQLYKELADKNLQLLAKLQVVSYRTQPVEKLISLYRHLTTHVDELDTLVDYNALALGADNYGVARAIVTDYEAGLLQDPLDKVFEKSFYTDWLEAVRGANQFLQGFFADRHQETIEELRSLDATYNELTKEEIFSRLLEALPRVSTNTKLKSSENIMLQRAILSKGRSYTIRKLFSAVPNMITKLAPCMLMSPMSVAQYLEPGFPPFDLVIFDEASQMPTYDAIGAIARGKELIVVGDPKQLPPTTFFSTKESEDEAEDPVLCDLESILDDCIALQLPNHHLRWHYRSKYESLIAFSNKNFYQDALITFPAASETTSAVSFIPVDGIYDKGKSRTNVAEAEMVVARVQELVHQGSLKGKHPSIGIVTLSQAQQSLIEDMLDDAGAEDEALEAYMLQDQKEPLFVKNLENVQGDERDIIMLSICYGKDLYGRMSINFGPINKEGGERRLNVAISRAKEQLMVFSSISYEDIDLTRSKSVSLRFFRNFLQYAQGGYGTVSQIAENATPYTQGGYDVARRATSTDPIIEKVHSKLLDAGYTVERWVGSSQYKIPLAIKDPAQEKYLLGIEFDNEGYASIATARDRDVLASKVLMGLQWNLYRVWSQEWLMRPERVFEKICEAIEAAQKVATSGSCDTLPSAEPVESQYIANFATHRVAHPQQSTPMYKAKRLRKVQTLQENFYAWSYQEHHIKRMVELTQAEAPLHKDVLYRRIVEAWRMTRVGDRIRRVLDDCLQRSGVFLSYFDGQTFCWSSEEQYRTYSIYRGCKKIEERRDIDKIAPEEVFNAVEALIQEAVRVEEDDLIRATAECFGYDRVAGSTLETLKKVLHHGVAIGRLQVDSNGQYVGVE